MQGSKKRFEGANELNLESYQTRLEIAPSEVSLIRIREPQPNDQITLKFTLKNESDKGSTLYFPTSQRCEAIIRDSEGKVIYTWSEDYEFAPDAGYSYLNAGEHLNYQITIPMSDAQRYPVVMAWKINDQPIPVRAKGPLFIAFPYDNDAALRTAQYYERSIWQLKQLNIQ